MQDKVHKGWKIATIILSIFLVLIIVTVGLLINIGTKVMANESECAYNICEDYSTYYYDSVDNLCYCFENDEIALTRYIN